MSSLTPFQDLNLIPTASFSFGASSSSHIAPTLTVPKLEPKIEPYDESLPPQTHHFLQESGSVVTLVPVHFPEENRLPTAFPKWQRQKLERRSSELVRITTSGIEDERYHRDRVRKTRMLYSSLRNLTSSDVDNRKRNRSTIDAGSFMRDSGLWLNRDKRVVGSIPGVEVGDIFFYRMELCVLGLHGQTQAGLDYLPASLSPNGEPVTTSIIFWGGYEGDEDSGDVIIYTGLGGKGGRRKQPAGNQELKGGMLGLCKSMQYGIEIRVIRGFKNERSPNGKIFIYDGLYEIEKEWRGESRSDPYVLKYKLVRKKGQPEMGSTSIRDPLSARPALRYQNYQDISGLKEKRPVPLFNEIDGDTGPAFYHYIARALFSHDVYHSAGAAGTTGCGCVDGCRDNCACAMKNGGDFPYNHEQLLVKGKPLIFECGPSCPCPPDCKNRLSQRGLRYKFEIFRSKETGWGVRSPDPIQAGSFICEYAGIALTREQAQILSMNGGQNLIHPDRFPKRWMEWGNLSSIIPDYVHPKHPSTLPLNFVLDVSRSRNLASYIRRSPIPNLMAQFVLYDHNNSKYPRLMLFALENIPPLRELSLDYGAAQTPTATRTSYG
ncbi:histone-lysine N-methyltransferase family member SUVH2-like [Impatiens glandulifera]|uniref:histone-lysine N-methyltransferase family member SUVH2-like n=1 Tax=Impatiens glandulifera TaxID=253017 RepID=UPI001FB145B3|nr:histone-lysine N-methyltransferase family member SUVH2-like [Impatiens glandulifera]